MKVWLELQVKNLKKVEEQVKESLGTVDLEAMIKTAQNTSNQIKSSFNKLDFKSIGNFLKMNKSASNVAAGAKEAGALTKIAATVGAVAGILFVIKKINQRMLNEMIKSSPYLQGILSVFNRAWTVMWRPFGDFLGSLLRPLAVALLKLSVKWLGFSRTETGQKVVKGAMGAGAGASVGAGIGAIVGGVTGGPLGALAGAGIGAVVGGIIGAIIASWETIKDKAGEWVELIKAWADKILKIFGIDMDKVRETVGRFFWETLPNFFTVTIPAWFSETISSMGDWGEWLWEKLTSIWDWTSDFAGWLWEKLTSIWDWTSDFAGWLWEKITGALSTAWTKLKDFATWVWGKITESLSNIYGVLSGFGDWVWTQITSIWKWAKDFGAWIWEKVTSIWSWGKDLGQWLYDKITGSLSNIGDKLLYIGQYMYNKVTDSISRAFSNFKFGWSWWWEQGTFQTGSNYVPKDGLYQLHQGEKVINSSKTAREEKASSIIFSPSFTINANGSSVSEIESTIRNSTRLLEFEIRRRSLV